jgi:hypothetical protein
VTKACEHLNKTSVISWPDVRLSAYQEGLCSMKSVTDSLSMRRQIVGCANGCSSLPKSATE